MEINTAAKRKIGDIEVSDEGAGLAPRPVQICNKCCAPFRETVRKAATCLKCAAGYYLSNPKTANAQHFRSVLDGLFNPADLKAIKLQITSVKLMYTYIVVTRDCMVATAKHYGATFSDEQCNMVWAKYVKPILSMAPTDSINFVALLEAVERATGGAGQQRQRELGHAFLVRRVLQQKSREDQQKSSEAQKATLQRAIEEAIRIAKQDEAIFRKRYEATQAHSSR